MFLPVQNINELQIYLNEIYIHTHTITKVSDSCFDHLTFLCDLEIQKSNL